MAETVAQGPREPRTCRAVGYGLARRPPASPMAEGETPALHPNHVPQAAAYHRSLPAQRHPCEPARVSSSSSSTTQPGHPRRREPEVPAAEDTPGRRPA